MLLQVPVGTYIISLYGSNFHILQQLYDRSYVSCTYILVIETNKIFRIPYFVLHITFSENEIITMRVVVESGRSLRVRTSVKSKQILFFRNGPNFSSSILKSRLIKARKTCLNMQIMAQFSIVNWRNDFHHFYSTVDECNSWVFRLEIVNENGSVYFLCVVQNILLQMIYKTL